MILPASETNVQLSVFHNAAALASRRARAQALAWPFDRRLAAVNLRLVETMAGYFQGELKTETRERVGTMTTLFLPRD